MIDNINQKGGEKIQINVVGSINNQEDIAEIETVAKVFIVAERMKDLTDEVKTKNDMKRPSQDSPRKIKDYIECYNKNNTLLSVRGFN